MKARKLRRAVPAPVRRSLTKALGGALVAAPALRPGQLPDASIDAVFARNRYGIYCVPRACAHRPAPRALLRGRVWEPETLALLRGIPGDVVHAGTFFGDFLPALAARDGTVWAFEPNRESFRCAQVTVLLNDLQNVSLKHAALGDEPGSARLVTADGRGVPFGGESRIAPDGETGTAYEEVPVVTVDQAVPDDRHVGVIELDVEGHERPALLGATNTIARCRPVLVLESVPAAGLPALGIDGYERAARVNGNTVFRPV